MNIKTLEHGDIDAFIDLLLLINEEMSWQLFGSEDSDPLIEQVTSYVQQLIKMDRSVIFVAEEDDRFVGFISAHSGIDLRTVHTANVKIGILHEFTGRGIGMRLFERLQNWALQQGLKRLELTVMERDRASLLLYSKAGFSIEGMRKESLYLNGNFVDEFYMAKVLPRKADEL